MLVLLVLKDGNEQLIALLFDAVNARVLELQQLREDCIGVAERRLIVLQGLLPVRRPVQHELGQAAE